MRWILLLFSLQLAAKELKLLVLTIASDDKPYYVEQQKVWRSYMNYDPKHVECYFLKFDPKLETAYKIEDNTIWIQGKETYIPGLGDKTVLALEAMKPRLKEFDFVLRTNLSSFYVFPRLFKTLSKLPKNRCYFACENQIIVGGGAPYIPFGSGAGFVLSIDLAEEMVKHKQELLGSDMVDDVLFGWFFHKRNILLRIANRMDILDMPTWISWKTRLPEDQYHFRLKNNSEHRRLTHEVQVHQELARMFYGKKAL